MTYNRGIQQYQTVGAQSAAYADPHRLVQMLMDGAIDRMAQAKGAIQRGDAAAKGSLIGKAIAIIGGLQGSLDNDAGGEIADNLERLYDYMQRRLLQANLRSDIAALDEVSGLLREIRSAWVAIPADAREAAKPAAGNGTTG